jgi:hypothetical protein
VALVYRLGAHALLTELGARGVLRSPPSPGPMRYASPERGGAYLPHNIRRSGPTPVVILARLAQGVTAPASLPVPKVRARSWRSAHL